MNNNTSFALGPLLVSLVVFPIMAEDIIVAPAPDSSVKILQNVPLTRQSTFYSCGAAALQSVLGYYGIEYTEKEVMDGSGTNSSGAEREGLTKFARKNGINALNHENLSWDDLLESLENNHPVIVEIQAWPDETIEDYSNVWSEGHYIVVIGMTAKEVYFMDPSILGGRGVITKDEFLKRWHEINSKGKKAYHTGILLEGHINPMPPWQFIP